MDYRQHIKCVVYLIESVLLIWFQCRDTEVQIALFLTDKHSLLDLLSDSIPKSYKTITFLGYNTNMVVVGFFSSHKYGPACSEKGS